MWDGDLLEKIAKARYTKQRNGDAVPLEKGVKDISRGHAGQRLALTPKVTDRLSHGKSPVAMR